MALVRDSRHQGSEEFLFGCITGAVCAGTPLTKENELKVLPVVMRELSVSARRPFTYWARLVVGMLGFGAALFVFNIGNDPTSERGETLLVTLGVITLVVGLLSGIFLTADCISEEKREGTLGLLFLTDLRSSDVVLGKLAAQSATAFAATWSLLPIMALPLMTGGVTLLLTLRVMLSLSLAMLLSLSAGLAVSSICRDSRKAALGTFSLVLVLAALPILTAVVWGEVTRKDPPTALVQFSPIMAFSSSFRSSFPGNEPVFARAVATVAGECVLFLAFASWATRFSWHRKDRIVVAETKGGSCAPALGRRRRFGLPILQEDLYGWLCRREPIGRGIRLLMGFLSLVWLISLIIAVMSTREAEAAFTTSVCTAALMHLIMKLEFALESTRQLHQDARSGGLELILATPLTEGQIIQGHVRAYHRRFFFALASLVWISLCLHLAIIIFYDHLHMKGGAFPVFSTFFIGGIIALYLDFRAMAWVGAWRALRSNTHLKAAMTTLAGVVGIPWLVGPPAVAIVMEMPGPEDERLMVVGVGWFIFSAVLSLLLGWRARRRVHARFRQAVARF